MYYLYLLHSQKTGKYYIGTTGDLQQRFYRHNQGTEISTRSGAPWKLAYYEAYPSKAAALERERKLKRYGKGLYELKKRIAFDE